MSEQNIELVRETYVHFNNHHEPHFELFDPDVEWHTAEDLPDSGVHRGVTRVAEFFKGWTTTFDGFTTELHELRDAGDRVVASVTLRGRLRDTGATVELPEVHVWSLRYGKVVEVREYRTLDHALAELELEVEAD